MENNKYASTLRRFITPALVRSTISPPANYTVSAVTASAFMLARNDPSAPLLSLFNPNSNMRVASIGLFSNFADGLVWYSDVPILVEVYARGYNPDPLIPFLTGALTVNAGSLTVAGGGALLTEIAGNDVLLIGGFPVIVDTVIDNSNFTIKYPIPVDVAAETAIQKLDYVGLSYSSSVYVNTLNDLVSCDSYLLPNAFMPVESQFMFVGGLVSVKQDITWLTKSIASAFNPSTCYFTVQADIEFTEKDRI